jgi:exodeoxyribonuclease X
VELCIDILNIIQHVAKTTSLEDLYAFSEDARVPRLMTFGKFKGQPISAVDKGYANWYRRQSDTDPYVIEAFRREGLV